MLIAQVWDLQAQDPGLSAQPPAERKEEKGFKPSVRWVGVESHGAEEGRRAVSGPGSTAADMCGFSWPCPFLGCSFSDCETGTEQPLCSFPPLTFPCGPRGRSEKLDSALLSGHCTSGEGLQWALVGSSPPGAPNPRLEVRGRVSTILHWVVAGQGGWCWALGCCRETFYMLSHV